MTLLFKYNEQELIASLKLRQERAFSYLYNNYSQVLYTTIKQLVWDTAKADDVLQEVFIIIWNKIETYDANKGRLFTWMLKIARNCSIDALRSKCFRNEQKNSKFSNNIDMKNLVTEIDIDKINFRKTLENLPDHYRVLVELAYFKGYTREEIADIKGIPVGTVKTQIRNALLQLKEFWNKENDCILNIQKQIKMSGNKYIPSM